MISRRSMFVWLSAAASVFGMISCTEPAERGTVHILGTWVDDQEKDFQEVLAPFRKSHPGINVVYTGTRDFDAVLESRVQSGEKPDLALLPSLGQFEQYARDGHLIALDDVAEAVGLHRIEGEDGREGEYSPDWLQFGKWGEGENEKRYGIVAKGSRKNVLWYSPEGWSRQIPHSWKQLVDVVESVETHPPTQGVDASPWCVGLRSGSATGWPGTDWIEDILLYQSGADVYERWRQGRLKWTDKPVRDAWEEWGRIIEAGLVKNGGSHRNRMLSTDFREANTPTFERKTGCYLHHVEPSAAGSSFFDFSANAGKRVVEVGGDILTMFNRTPEAEKLIDYLTGEVAQAKWVSMGGTISPNVKVKNKYPNDAIRELASTIDKADRIVFDASDYMPVAMRTAFHNGVLEFVAEPQRLVAQDGILPGLEDVRCQLVRDGAYPGASAATC